MKIEQLATIALKNSFEGIGMSCKTKFKDLRNGVFKFTTKFESKLYSKEYSQDIKFSETIDVDVFDFVGKCGDDFQEHIHQILSETWKLIEKDELPQDNVLLSLAFLNRDSMELEFYLTKGKCFDGKVETESDFINNRYPKKCRLYAWKNIND